MVMGPTHAMCGIAGGLGLSALVPPTGGAPTGVVASIIEAAVVGVLTTGGTMLADIDSPSSTVSRSFGAVSQGLSHVVNGLSAAYCNATASSQDGYRTDGHRGLTHTVWFALALGIAVTVAVAVFGLYALLPTLFVTSGLAIRGLMHEWAKKNGWIVVTTCSALMTILMLLLIDPTWLTWLAEAMTIVGIDETWLVEASMTLGVEETRMASLAGASITWGLVLHCLGDAITKEGCPLFAPVRVPWSGKNWHDVALPGPLRIRVGGRFEKALLLPGLTVIAFGLAVWSVPIEQELALL